MIINQELIKSYSEDYKVDDFPLIGIRLSLAVYAAPQISKWKQNQPLWKWLVEQLVSINPHLDINQFLKENNVFFNVVNGNFENDLSFMVSFIKKDQIISEQETEIINLKIFLLKSLF